MIHHQVDHQTGFTAPSHFDKQTREPGEVFRSEDGACDDSISEDDDEAGDIKAEAMKV